MDSEFMRKLEQLRVIMDRSFIVTSAYRSPEHNDKVSSTGLTGPHTTGRAIDISMASWYADAYILVAAAMKLGFTGVGVKMNGEQSGRFIHLDDLKDNRPRIWSY
tara:strand:- start:495 stop:809 length:315 start_codon:yes stop_codon:yes gene_type:complete